MSAEGCENPYEGLPAGPPGAGTSAMLIRIFGKKDQEPYGDIVHYHLKKPVPYQGAAQLVLKIDAISRSLDIPSSETVFRSTRRSGEETGNVLPEEYWQEKATATERKAVEQKNPEIPDSPEAPGSTWTEGQTGTDTGSFPKVRDTIYLQLVGRYHTSIQGRIWGNATRKQYISFRSALELIYLLSEAV